MKLANSTSESRQRCKKKAIVIKNGYKASRQRIDLRFQGAEDEELKKV